MPIYHTLGNIPHKRHTVFEKEKGGYYYEQLFGTIGFEGMSSLLYHVHRPTMVKAMLGSKSITPKIAEKTNTLSRCFIGFNVASEKDYLNSRKAILVNQDCQIELAAPQSSMDDYFYKNADEDELLFVHNGNGVLKTLFGNLEFSPGDYLLIPRGVIYQIHFETADNRLFIVTSHRPIYTPKRYRNCFGQLLEHAPYCERDIRKPKDLETHDELGDFTIMVKKQGMLHEYIYASHPFDVVGWDGYNYPYAFSIHDFESITGRVHQPPPVHQTFETDAFVVCSFCPRLYDYHPQAIPAPYNHSNIDSDEVLYYVDGDFMSRNHIEKGYMSLHPSGIPHGPHPGAMERSIGQKETAELAVMVDTFKPLMVTEYAYSLELPDYYKSWLE
ncbi:homogentisate 1,2-dioxygenase [Flavobacterium sp. L1I52]|uniref:Homogentisate 1,2-dioxygenase n=1 Tax=Flavobacterium pokkalii TaxID=1940408 RepID=A0ABR7URC6_9FLAO|nr:homogentisate 1,2-dioxygenase [Flavobacterium pokkalii]MBD0725462.1 homogentisate 1,2-dioxygenase [Flavobacterium pokkalii]